MSGCCFSKAGMILSCHKARSSERQLSMRRVTFSPVAGLPADPAGALEAAADPPAEPGALACPPEGPQATASSTAPTINAPIGFILPPPVRTPSRSLPIGSLLDDTVVRRLMTTRHRDRRPLPLVLGDELRALVREELQAGAQLPTESEISTRYQVGRSTVREALKTLEQDGLIEVRHGRGRFVART